MWAIVWMDVVLCNSPLVAYNSPLVAFNSPLVAYNSPLVAYNSLNSRVIQVMICMYVRGREDTALRGTHKGMETKKRSGFLSFNDSSE